MSADSLFPSIPRRIWMFWDSGLENAPDVVSLCLRSWKQLNPDWTVTLLTRENLSDYVELDALLPGWEHLPVQQQADLLRLELLAQYGGIWADATVMCSRPLVDWFPSNHRAGMVLIDVPESSDKFFGSFFLASTPGHHFIIRWRDLFARYLAPPPDRMSGAQVKRLVRKIPLARPKLGRVLLVTPLVRQKFGSPYFALHYLGTWLLMSSPRALWTWLRRPQTRSGKYSALVRQADGVGVFRQKLESHDFGVWKLTYKVQDDQRDLFNGVIAVAEDFVAQHPATD